MSRLARLRAQVDQATGSRVLVDRAELADLLREVAIVRQVPDLDALTGQQPATRPAAPTPGRLIQAPDGRGSGRIVFAVTGEDAHRLAVAAWETAPASPWGHSLCPPGEDCGHLGGALWGPWETTRRVDLRCATVQAARRTLGYLADHPPGP